MSNPACKRTGVPAASFKRVCRAWHESSRVKVPVPGLWSRRLGHWASASSRGGVQRKPKAKSQGDEQKPDMRRDAFGTSGHVAAKPSIYKWVATPTRVHFVNPASMRGRICVLPREICHVS